jgi:hypothetical protein
MALSVFGVCASAANVEDYADADEITYTEAVGVLSGLGVLEGDENGFRPADTLTRAEAAKIASYLIGLQDEVVQGPSFSDVEGNWAAGYIAICESQELVHGNGDGTFTPDGTLTGYEWEKMVLCALGYDATIEKMVGDSWQGGVANLAKKTGLLDGLSSDYKAANEITREQAAQIAYNALFTQTVVYPHTTDKIAGFGDKKLGELVFNLDVKNTFDVFGAPVAKVYYNTKTKDAYASFAIDPIAEYDNEAKAISVKEINEDLTDELGIKGASVTSVYVDGAKDETFTTSTTVGGRGVEVDVYKYTSDYENNTTDIRVVVINTYVAKIGENKVSITKNTPNSNGVTAPNTVEGLVNGAYLLAGDLAKDDIITYNVGNEANLGKKANVVAVNAAVQTPEGQTLKTVSFNGTVEKAVAGGYVVYQDATDKLYFDVNAKYGTVTNNQTLKPDEYYSVVYDNYGNIIYIQSAKRQTVSTKGHLYVVDAVSYTKKDTTIDTSNIFYPVVTTEAGAQALVIEYTDDSAEAKIVDLAVAQDKDGSYVLVNKYGLIGPDCVKLGANYNQHAIAALESSFVEYYVNENGEYILEACEDAKFELHTKKATADVDVHEYTDKTNQTGDAGCSKVTATNDTKLTYITATVDPYTVITTETMPEILKSITLTATTVTGYKQFIDFDGTEAYLENSPAGLPAVGAVININNVKSTVEYAMYVGPTSESSVTGQSYAFTLSTGDTVSYNVEVPEHADEVVNTLGNGKVEITGTAGQFTGLKAGDVVKLVINSKGNVVAYKALTPYYGNASKVSYVNGAGWLTTAVNTDLPVAARANDTPKKTYFASVFGGKAIDVTGAAAEAVAITGLTAPTAKYVAVYTDDVDNVNKNDGAEIVFVKVVNPTTPTAITGAVKADSNGQYFSAVSPLTLSGTNITASDLWGKATADYKDGEGYVAIPTADHALYANETFDVALTKTEYTNGATATYAVDTVKAQHSYKKYDFAIYAIKQNDDESWTITESKTQDGAADFTYYTVAGDARYDSTTSGRNFSTNNLYAGVSITLYETDGKIVRVVNNDHIPS